VALAAQGEPVKLDESPLVPGKPALTEETPLVQHPMTWTTMGSLNIILLLVVVIAGIYYYFRKFTKVSVVTKPMKRAAELKEPESDPQG
jgi:hypothetical protein